MTTPWVVAGRVAPGKGEPRPGWLRVRGSNVEAVGCGRPPSGLPAVDVGDHVVAPGFVDLHVHGGGGRQVGGDTPEEVAGHVAALARHHVTHGTTALVATTVSDTPGRLEAAVRGVALAAGGRRPGAPEVLGVHLEGPWLAPSRRGAHDPAHLREPDRAELDRLLEAGAGAVRLLTLAPELPGAAELIAAAVAAGVVVAVGHTDADFATVRAAFAAGASHVTHLGNAMGAIDRRAPGPVAAALLDGTASVEVIADGEHVHPGFLALTAHAAPGRLVAVTDAVGACGMPPGRYRLGPSEVVLEHDRVTLAEQPATLAGSVLTMDRAVGTLVAAGLEPGAALAAASGVPARVLGAAAKGRLVAGADADLVVLDGHWEAVATVVGGVVAWDRDGRFGGPSPAAQP